MKKYAFVLFALVAVGASADIGVRWTSINYVKNHENTWDSYTGYAQLIWSATDPVSSTGNYTTQDGLDSSGNEYLLEEYSADYNYFPTDSLVGEFSDADVGGNSITNGFLFVRLYDTASVQEGSYYYQSEVISPELTEYDPTALDSIYVLNATGDIYDGNGVMANVQAIPEPATMLIFGPGIAGLLGYRRRKAKISAQFTAMFERRRAMIAARKAAIGTEREDADYATAISGFISKVRQLRFDPLGDALMAIDKLANK